MRNAIDKVIAMTCFVTPKPLAADDGRKGSIIAVEESNRLPAVPGRYARQNVKSAWQEHDIPLTDREQWWRGTMKDTPIPGTYEMGDFICDISRRPMTYSFKSNGRVMDPTPLTGKGKLLMPGAYQHQDLVYNLNKSRRTYSFKSSKRKPGDIVKYGIRKDKNVNIPPNQYNTAEYLSIRADDAPTKNWFFKSESQRLPTKSFKPLLGPGPGKYESMSECTLGYQSSVTSSFRSKTPRFTSSHTRVPGPGTYDKSYQHGKTPRAVTQMGRNHGLFFTSGYR